MTKEKSPSKQKEVPTFDQDSTPVNPREELVQKQRELDEQANLVLQKEKAEFIEKFAKFQEEHGWKVEPQVTLGHKGIGLGFEFIPIKKV